ncbi:MAG TPA: VanZ family protein [Gemmatimonadales bacterium]|nr:VanZ family protein [Gemmatimonadales bacterium]
MRPDSPRRRAGVAITAGAILAILLATMAPGGDLPEPGPAPRWAITDILLNVVLFIPLGIGLGLLGVRGAAAGMAGAIVSVAIEAAQLYWIPNRDASIHDVVSNALGAALGALVVVGWPGRILWWRIAGPILASLMTGFWGAGAVLVQPARPVQDRVWWAEWEPLVRGAVRFPGRLLSLSLQGVGLPDGAIPESQALAARLARADTVVFSAVVETGPALRGRSKVAGVFMGNPRGEYVGLWQDRRALLIYQRLRMTGWGLRAPVLRIPGAFPASGGDTVTVTVRITLARVDATVRAGHADQQGTLRLGSDLAWSGFLPFEYQPTRGERIWTTLLGFAAFLIVGAGLAQRAGLQVLAAGAALVAGPLFAGSVLPSSPVFLAAALGVPAGSLLASRLGLIGRASGSR